MQIFRLGFQDAGATDQVAEVPVPVV